MDMEKEYTKEVRSQCKRVADAFQEIYEMYGDMCVLDAEKFGFVVLCWFGGSSFDENAVYKEPQELFDDLWEMWLDYKLLHSVLGTGREEIDYEQLYTELPENTKKEYENKKKYFMNLAGLPYAIDA